MGWKVLSIDLRTCKCGLYEQWSLYYTGGFREVSLHLILVQILSTKLPIFLAYV